MQVEWIRRNLKGVIRTARRPGPYIDVIRDRGIERIFPRT